MSKKDYYLAKADEAAALAEQIQDALSRQSLRQAVSAWILLAELETAPTPLIGRRAHPPDSDPSGEPFGA